MRNPILCLFLLEEAFYKILIILLFIIPLLFAQCKDNSINGDDNIPTSRIVCVWTVDKLFLLSNPFTGITGTSPQDVWAIAPGGFR